MATPNRVALCKIKQKVVIRCFFCYNNWWQTGHLIGKPLITLKEEEKNVILRNNSRIKTFTHTLTYNFDWMEPTTHNPRTIRYRSPVQRLVELPATIATNLRMKIGSDCLTCSPWHGGIPMCKERSPNLKLTWIRLLNFVIVTYSSTTEVTIITYPITVRITNFSISIKQQYVSYDVEFECKNFLTISKSCNARS